MERNKIKKKISKKVKSKRFVAKVNLKQIPKSIIVVKL